MSDFAPGTLYPVLPLRDIVVYPHMIVPLFVGREKSVLALEDCTALRIDNSRLYGLYNEDIEQFTLIQMNLARELARRLRMADERLFMNHTQAKNINGEYRFVTM